MCGDRPDAITKPHRTRLPNRRRAETTELAIGGMPVLATVGFHDDGQPAELFLNSGKTGSAIDALLGDAAVAISVVLQHSVRAAALAKSVARIPETIDGPAVKAASPIGAALDLIAQFETPTATGS
jgi:hypothetical protein